MSYEVNGNLQNSYESSLQPLGQLSFSLLLTDENLTIDNSNLVTEKKTIRKNSVGQEQKIEQFDSTKNSSIREKNSFLNTASTLEKTILAAASSGYTGTNLGQSVTGLNNLFKAIQEAINKQIFVNNLPLVGKGLNNAIALTDLWNSSAVTPSSLTLANIASKLSVATGGTVSLMRS